MAEGDTLGNKLRDKEKPKTTETKEFKKSEFTGPCPRCGKKLEQVGIKTKIVKVRGKEVERKIPKCSKCKV